MADIDPTRTALLVMDYQPGILGRLGDGAASLLDRAAGAIATVRRHGGQIGYVRVGFDDDDLAALPPESGMGRRLGDNAKRMHADAPATAVHGAVAPEPGDVVVRKTRVGAFSTTDLDAQLRARGVDTLLLAGVSTSGVVLSTVRDAHDRDYRVIVLEDATADPKPDVHRFLTESILPAQAEVMTTDELDGRLAG